MDKKKLDLEEFNILQTLGIGSFGRVRLALHKESGEYCALKILKKHELVRLKQVDHVLSEHKILGMIQHPFMVNQRGIVQNERYLYIVMDFVPGGELFTYLRKQRQLASTEARFYAAQVVLMFEYLHSQNVIYRDLKPENLLIHSDGYLKLADFGFAKVVDGRTYTLCGTPEFIAPEILLNKGHGKPVDWWTLGILIYEMLAGADPFTDDDPMVIYQKILKGKIRFSRNFDRNAKSLVRHLVIADLSKRYGNLRRGVADIKNHRWFSGYDFTRLANKEYRPEYCPTILHASDSSNFSNFPDSDVLSTPLPIKEDPFLDW